MRSWLNLALVGAAGALSLVLTVVRQTPEGVSLAVEVPDVRAAPGEPPHHDLSALAILNKTLVKVKDRYVDPSRIDPKKMLYSALESVTYNVPEVLIEADEAHNKVTVRVNDKVEVFDTDDVDSPWHLVGKLRKILPFIQSNMNAGADLAKVEYAAVNGMLSTLDPHSILMDPEQARDMDVSTSGKFGGLGIVIRMVDHKLTVVKPMKDTPAWRAGIKPGDHIVKINSDATENLSSNEAVDRMRGDPKTAVTLWVERKGATDGSLQRFDLVRDVIRVSAVDHKLLDHGVGYIRVKQFSKGIASDVGDAMKEMSAQGANAWILDLRGNPGGLLDEAVQLSDLFVDQGTIVTTVSGRDRDARRAEHGFGDTRASIAVLVNGGSASASEIAAGALKNLDRAVIIGTRTFGKGSVQELYDNEDKSKLKLTIAQYLTPGDRSIQNVGIVPDILLQRMDVPEKNDSPSDYLRLLAPTHIYGEKDLDAHLVSTYAKDTDKPEWEVPFLFEKPVTPTASAAATAATPPPDDEDAPDTDDIIEDFPMTFARDLVSTVSSPSRPKLVTGAQKLVARVHAEQEKKLIAAFAKLNVDWSAPGADTGAANLDVALTTSAPNGDAMAGDTISLTATVKNIGTATAYRVLPRVETDDGSFEDVELPVGKVAPGETKTFTAQVALSKDALDRVDRLDLDVREARGASWHVAPTVVKITSLPRPVFAYSYQLVDESNGDGLVQRGENFKLKVHVKNTGAGATGPDGYTVLLRNASGDGVELGKSRFEIGKDQPKLAPGQSVDYEFPVKTEQTLQGDELVLELMAFDDSLSAETSEKLHFKISPAVAAVAARGDVTVKASQVEILTGAAPDANPLAIAPRGASFEAIATYGDYTKVKLGPSGSTVGFIASRAVTSGGSGTSVVTASLNTTPPAISLQTTHGLETTSDTYHLAGTATDENHVEDVYAFVSNQGAKIDRRKVFYRSNRGGHDPHTLDFAAELPLWPGSNTVEVVARSSTEVRTVRTEVIYRDPPRTAQVP